MKICVSGKWFKVRVPALVVADVDRSDKGKVMFIRKSKNPRCFKGCKKFAVSYHINWKAWMTSDLLDEWLRDFNVKWIKKEEKLFFLIGNRTLHGTRKKNLKSITICLFPSNVILKLQPMDQGISNSLRRSYWVHFLHHILFSVEKRPVIDIKIACEMLNDVWCDVKLETTKNCWSHVEFALKYQMTIMHHSINVVKQMTYRDT